jgi:cell wall-associated NlpC family hydrolase
MTPDAFIAAAMNYLKVPWKHEGRSARGVDCVGLVFVAAWDAGLVARSKDEQGYIRQPQELRFAETFEKYMHRKPFAERKPGDVLLHRVALRPCHCSILFDRPGYGESILHSDIRRRGVTIDPLDENWRAISYSFCFTFFPDSEAAA